MEIFIAFDVFTHRDFLNFCHLYLLCKQHHRSRFPQKHHQVAIQKKKSPYLTYFTPHLLFFQRNIAGCWEKKMKRRPT